MRRIAFVAALTAVLGACEPAAPPAPTLTAEQAARVSAVWNDKKWAGTWGDPCTGAIHVYEMIGAKARVEYKYGVCREGGSPGTGNFANAVATETTLDMKNRSGTRRWTYTIQPDGSVTGVFQIDGKDVASGIFRPVSKI